MGLSVTLAERRVTLGKDTARARAATREVIARVVTAITPARRAAVAIMAGVGLVVWGLALWSVTVAMITAGVSLVVYGAVLVDLDASPVRRRRKKKAVTDV